MFTSVVLTWAPPQEPNGVIIAYDVSYMVNGSNPIHINTLGTTTTITLELALDTRVSDISVRAYTSIGPGNATMHRDVFTQRQRELCNSINSYIGLKNPS